MTRCSPVPYYLQSNAVRDARLRDRAHFKSAQEFHGWTKTSVPHMQEHHSAPFFILQDLFDVAVSATSLFPNLVEPAGSTGILEEVNHKGHLHEMAAIAIKTNHKMATTGGMANHQLLEGPQNGQFQAKCPPTTQAPESKWVHMQRWYPLASSKEPAALMIWKKARISCMLWRCSLVLLFCVHGHIRWFLSQEM